MRVDELCAALDATGLPWAQDTWWPEAPPPLPYLLLCAEGFEASYADNRTIACATTYRVELYSHGRDYGSERLVGEALGAAGFAWDRRDVGVIDQTDVRETCWVTSAFD